MSGFQMGIPDGLNTGLLKVHYSDVSVIQMFVIQIPTVMDKSNVRMVKPSLNQLVPVFNFKS